MPIFISRFSADRGAIGLLQGARAKGTTGEQKPAPAAPSEEEVRRASAQQSDARASQAAGETGQSAQSASRRQAEPQDAQAGEADSRRAVDGRDGLTAVGNTGLAFTLTVRRIEVKQQREEARPAEQATRRAAAVRQNGKADVKDVKAQAKPAEEAGKGRPGQSEATQNDNQKAAESTGSGGIGGIAQRLQGLQARGRGEEEKTARRTGREEGPATTLVIRSRGGLGQAITAQGTEQLGRAREGRNTEPVQGGEGAAALPAEAQRQEVRDTAREIGQGLQRDATAKNSQNAQQATRSASRAVEASQRQEARQSQEQARDLQAEHRRLQQEVRQTEQQIRQLQSRAGSAGSAATVKTANALAAGSNINILAL